MPKLDTVHPVFHVSIVKKYIGDPSLVVPIESIRVKDGLFYEEDLVELLDHQVQGLRNKEVSLMKVL